MCCGGVSSALQDLSSIGYLGNGAGWLEAGGGIGSSAQAPARSIHIKRDCECLNCVVCMQLLC